MTRLERLSLVVMSAAYFAAGVNHFVNPSFYVQIMPPYLPWHLPLVLLSGVAEIVLAIALWIRPLRRLAAFGIVLLLIAVFPANLHMALHDVRIDGEIAGPRWALWLRLPVQGLLVLWALWHARRAKHQNRAEAS